MTDPLKVDLCVIGAGSAGLSVAAAASQMGLKVVLIEKAKMGGDCLNYGCVPSKSLLAAAKCANTMRHSDVFGISKVEPQVDYLKLRDHIRGVIEKIAPHDSVERFTGLGVTVILGAARFVNRRTIDVGGERVVAKRFVIATGASPATPPIPGLAETPFLTNETIFDLAEKPEHLIVIGGGPIGCELAQAHLLLGAKVTVLELFNILPKDDAECADIIRQKMLSQGLQLFERIKVDSVKKTSSGVAVDINIDGNKQTIEGSHLLVSAGRKLNIDGLDLEKAGVKFSDRGIAVDARLRTSNKKIFAIGDVIGSFQFTHIASYHAGIVIRNALFHLPAKVDYKSLPWVTYTEPEMAHVGLNEVMAKDKGVQYKILKMDVSEIDRNQAEHQTDGLIKVLVTPKGKILGATIVGAEAGELILPWCLAIQNNLKISAMASVIVPYPTRNDISKRVAGSFFTKTLYSPKMKRIIRFLANFTK